MGRLFGGGASDGLKQGIREGVARGLTKGLSDLFAADHAAMPLRPIPALPADLHDRLKWAAALWRDAKKRSARDSPAILGSLVAAGERRILEKLLVGWDAEIKAAQGTEAGTAETRSGSVHDGPVGDSRCAPDHLGDQP